MKRVVLRADGSKSIGFGHVYRLLALAEILKSEFVCVFVTCTNDEFVLREIRRICSDCILLGDFQNEQIPDQLLPEQEISFDMDEILNGDEIVVTDGLLFGRNYQEAVKLKGSKLVSIDDMAVVDFVSDIVINHAPSIDLSKYRIGPSTILKTGLNSAILRMSFFNPIPVRISHPFKAFVSLGGADYFGFSLKLTQLLLQMDVFESIHLLCSSSFDKKLFEDLKTVQERKPNVHLHVNLDACQLIDILDDCTHAFVSASTVLIESYSRGLKCFCGYYTNNQKQIYDGFVTERKAVGLGDFNDLSLSVLHESFAMENYLNVLKESLNSKESLRKLFHTL
jgi:UDP-2,4-diacetamido-2,4,6-trideoxy-beta-L-altropyranose hydrolase